MGEAGSLQKKYGMKEFWLSGRAGGGGENERKTKPPKKIGKTVPQGLRQGRPEGKKKKKKKAGQRGFSPARPPRGVGQGTKNGVKKNIVKKKNKKEKKKSTFMLKKGREKNLTRKAVKRSWR